MDKFVTNQYCLNLKINAIKCPLHLQVDYWLSSPVNSAELRSKVQIKTLVRTVHNHLQ